MTTTAMIRVSARTRDRMMVVARQDYGGVTADEALRRLIDEHWEQRAVDAMDRFRREDPDGYSGFLDEIRQIAETDVAVAEPWDDDDLAAA